MKRHALKVLRSRRHARERPLSAFQKLAGIAHEAAILADCFLMIGFSNRGFFGRR